MERAITQYKYNFNWYDDGKPNITMKKGDVTTNPLFTDYDLKDGEKQYNLLMDLGAEQTFGDNSVGETLLTRDVQLEGVIKSKMGAYAAQSATYRDSEAAAKNGGDATMLGVINIIALYSSAYACHYNAPKW